MTYFYHSETPFLFNNQIHIQLKALHLSIFILFFGQLSAQSIHKNIKMQAVIDFDKEHYFAKGTSGKWGFCDAEASLLVATDFDTLYPLHRVVFNKESFAFHYVNSKFLIGRQGERYILMDLQGNKKLNVASIMPRLMGDAVLVKDNNFWGLAKTSGDLLVPIHCTAIDWYDDLLALKEKDKWVLFHPKQGKLLKEHRYDKITQLMPNIFPTPKTIHFLVQEKGLYGVINQDAEFVIPIEYEQLDELVSRENSGKEIKFLTKKRGMWGLLSNKNEILIEQQYDSLLIKNSDQPFVIFQKEGQWGVMDIHGKELINQCSQVESLKELGMKQFKVYQNGKVGLLEGNNGLVLPIEYNQIEVDWLFYTCTKDNKITYINTKTKKEIGLPEHQQTDFFSYQYFKIQVNKKWGLMDFTGKMIVEPSYDYISNIASQRNRVLVNQNQKQGLIDSLGKIIVPTAFDDIQTIYLGQTNLKEQEMFFVVNNNNKNGLIDYNGKILLPLVYDKIHYDKKFFDGYFEVELNNQKGIMTWEGKAVLEPNYEHLSRIKSNGTVRGKDGLWLVEHEGQKGLIEIKNAIATTLLPMINYNSIVPIADAKKNMEAYFIVEQNNKFGVYNTATQKVVVPIEYEAIKTNISTPKNLNNLSSVQQQLFSVQKEGNFIYVDLDGQLFSGAVEK